MTAARLSTSVSAAPGPGTGQQEREQPLRPDPGGGVADQRHDRADHPHRVDEARGAEGEVERRGR